jgi:hypothetical protein
MSRWIGRGALGGLLGAALAVAWLALARALMGPGQAAVPQETAAAASAGLVRVLWQLVLGTLAGAVAGGVFGAFGLQPERRACAIGGALVGLAGWAAATLGWVGSIFGLSTLASALAYAIYGAVAASFLGRGIRHPSRTT